MEFPIETEPKRVIWGYLQLFVPNFHDTQLRERDFPAVKFPELGGYLLTFFPSIEDANLS